MIVYRRIDITWREKSLVSHRLWKATFFDIFQTSIPTCRTKSCECPRRLDFVIPTQRTLGVLSYFKRKKNWIKSKPENAPSFMKTSIRSHDTLLENVGSEIYNFSLPKFSKWRFGRVKKKEKKKRHNHYRHLSIIYVFEYIYSIAIYGLYCEIVFK